ncbi:E3 ubiquitin-protein ligase listerin-like [Amphibalanus amphitrite]|uniref:E3 ubiquitin-protein ligase listerin-like n=1 Tax=Amphibalanus amphitrite TaxID=1232801 RepID=UPI001C904E9A|nr:E3 ubiquitin-protein ligase listerin-like [Amphibalanus amphitrite]
MGGKKQPRTKNNVQPSSSDRHAQRLGTEPLIGFSALSDLGYVPAAVGGALDDVTIGGVAIPGQLRALLKKMEKKDAITKAKAVQEFAELSDTLELDDVRAAVPFWPRLYRKLATDVDNRVRELAHVALLRLLARVRRAATPHMNQLVPTWLCCQSDPHPPAASAARRAFQGTFPAAEKQTGVVKFCYSSVLNHIREGLYELTPHTYSDASAMSADELEARYVRLLTGCLGALRLVAELVPPPPDTDGDAARPPAVSDQPLAELISNSKFTKLAKHAHPQVRRVWFGLLSALCSRRPLLVTAAAARLAPAVMHGLHEQEPSVLSDAWDAAISVASTVPDCWSHVNLRKAVLPQLWAALREGGRGCAVTLHPLMIVLLSKLPSDVAGGDQTEFYRLFFTSLCQGLEVERVQQSRREVSVICRTVWECALYVLRSQQCSEQVIAVIVEQLVALTGAAVSGPLAAVAPHLLPPLSVGLNSLYTVSAAGGGGAETVAAAQRLLWSALETAVLRQHLAAGGAGAAAAVDLLLAASSVSPEPPAAGRARVTFSEGPPAEQEPPPPAGERLSPLALAAGSPLQECAARAGQRLMDAVRAASASAGQRRLLVRLLVGVPGVAERVAAGPAAAGGPGRPLYDALMEPELAAGDCRLSEQLLPTVWRLCEPDQRLRLAEHVTQRGYLSVVAELLERAAEDPQLRDWALSDGPLAAVLSAVHEAPSADSALWRHVLRAVPALLRYHSQQTDSDPAAALLSAVTGSDGWRLEQLAPLLAPSCRSPDALLAAHGAALTGAGPAALAALQARLVAVGGAASDTALAGQLRAVLSSDGTPAGRQRLRAATRAWGALLGADRFCPLLETLLPAGWESDGRRPRAQLCLLLRRRASLRPPAACSDTAAASDGVADYLRQLLVELLAEWPAGESGETEQSATKSKGEADQPAAESDSERPITAAALRFLPDLLTAHVISDAAAELEGAADRSGLLAAESQLTELVTSLSGDQLTALRQTVTERALSAEDGVDAAALALLLSLSGADQSVSLDQLQDNIQLVLPCVSLLPDAALLSLVTSAAEGSELLALAGAAAALRRLAARRGAPWLLAEAGSCVVRALDAVVRARDAGLLPCSWLEADADWERLARNVAVLRFFSALLEHCCELLEPAHWDVLLLAVSSWVAGLQESSDSACLPAGRGVGAPVLLHSLCCAVEAVRAAVGRCAEQHPSLSGEWDELYSPEWYRALVSVFATMATDGAAGRSAGPLLQEALSAVCAVVVHAPTAALLHHALPVRVDSRLEERHLSADLVTLLFWWRRLLTSADRGVRLAAWHTMHRFLPHLAEAEQNRPHHEDDKDDPRLTLPTLFRAVIDQTEPLVSALLSELSPGQTCLVDPHTESHQVVLTHLMAWHLALSFTGHQDTQRKVMTAEGLRQDGSLDTLLNQLFCLMPETPEVPNSYVETSETFFELELPTVVTGGRSAEEVHHWACRTYVQLLRQLPVLARAWRSGCERQLAQRVQRLTSEHVSPLLLAEEFRRLQAADTVTDNMTVRARPSVREVLAVYTMEEASTELVVRLPADYPLGHVAADAPGRRVGVAAGQWRMWMLQLTTFLTHQNGSVLDGLLLWKQNIDKRFQGVEECNICFYVLHGTNYQLPKLACRNCKKRFHPACLYKWFSTSSKSTCPMCRQLF